MKNVLEKFEQQLAKNKDKVIFADVNNSITFGNFEIACKQVASAIEKFSLFKTPIAVLDGRDVSTLVGMFGVVYSGNPYVVLDSSSPLERLLKICQVVSAKLVLFSSANRDLAIQLKNALGCEILEIESCKNLEIDHQFLNCVRSKSVAADPVYILFTSGSTGVPKGTVITHANLLSYVEWFASSFEVNENTIFAGQTQFYFSASVSDIFSTLMYGATYHIVPKSYFSFPMQLINFLNERKVNTIYWVPTALCIVANLNLFAYAKPKFLKRVMFIGEVMPNKQLNYWRKNVDAIYANLFGPTETTDVCTFYVVDRPFKDDESLPIGKACNNADTFVIDENNALVTTPNVVGELYVRGPFVAPGYYNSAEQTKQAFVQNPTHNNYPDIVYKTGDLVMLNQFGEYMFVGRTDYQIKHKGYRIELGEIDRVAGSLAGIDNAISVYDKAEDKIVLIFVGKAKKEDVLKSLAEKLPEYMLPELTIKLPVMPLNQNGKMDRKFLLNNYKTLKGE